MKMGCASSTSQERPNIVICSSSDPDSVRGLIRHINERMPSVVEPESVRFEPLPYNIRDMNSFKFRGIDVLVLCHSIENRGLSLTNTPDSLYDKFLCKAKNCLGRNKVAVIIHDLPDGDLIPEILDSKMNSLLLSQGTTFKKSYLVLMVGTLRDLPVQLTQEQLAELTFFFRVALSDQRRAIVGGFYRFFYRISRR